eukprot:1551213-Prymnesium_polylepis.1
MATTAKAALAGRRWGWAVAVGAGRGDRRRRAAGGGQGGRRDGVEVCDVGRFERGSRWKRTGVVSDITRINQVKYSIVYDTLVP